MDLDLVDDGNSSGGNTSVSCELSKHQLFLLAMTRGASSVVCTVVCAILLGAVCRYMNWRFYEHRLLVYLTVVSLLYLLSVINQFVVLGRDSLDQGVHHGLCTTAATLTQLTLWLQLLVAVWIILYFVFSYGQPSYDFYDPHRALRRCKREILPLCVVIVWSAIFATVPVITDTYGLIGGWCWIRSLDDDCNLDAIGAVEQWVLFYAWQILLLVSAPIVLVIGVCRSYQIARRTEGTAVDTATAYRKKARASGIALTAYIAIYFLFQVYGLFVLLYIYVSSSIRSELSTALVAIAPIRFAFLPLLALLYLYCAGKFPDHARQLQQPTDNVSVVNYNSIH